MTCHYTLMIVQCYEFSLHIDFFKNFSRTLLWQNPLFHQPVLRLPLCFPNGYTKYSEYLRKDINMSIAMTTYEVPQGLVLAPLPFILNMNAISFYSII